MFYASSDYNTNIIDSTKEQDFLLLRIDGKADPIKGFFSALDGDFTEGGVDVSQEVCRDGNLAFGGTPAGTISFELMNTNRVLSDFPWGNMAAYIGVEVGSSSFTVPADALCFITVGGNNYYGKADGLYKGSSRIYNSSGVPITGIVGDPFDGKIYALGEGACVSVTVSSGTVSAMTPTRHLAHKLMNGCSVNFVKNVQSSGANLKAERYDVNTGVKTTYEYVNVGYYVIERPDSLQNEVVSISDANNILALLDVDATSFLSGITYPITVGNFILAVLADLDIDIISASSIDAWSTSIASDPFGNTSYTKRDLLGFATELLGCVVAFDGCYNSSGYVLSPCVLKFVPPCGSSSVETIAWDRVQQQTLAVKDYTTPAISAIQLKKPDGTTETASITRTASEDSTYQISGNPLASTITDTMKSAVALSGFAFRPTSCDVISANPAVEMGDMVSIKVAAEDTEPETDVYGRPTGNTQTNDPAVVPLMSRTLHWQGNTSANYQATGDKARKVDKSTPVYAQAVTQRYTEIAVQDFSLSLDSEDVFNRLTDNGTIQGIFRDADTGDLYINGEWIQANTIRAGSIETLDGEDWLDVLNEFLGYGTDSNTFVRIGGWRAYAQEESGTPSSNYITFAPATVGGIFFTIIPAGRAVTTVNNQPATALLTFTGSSEDWALTKEYGLVQIQ